MTTDVDLRSRDFLRPRGFQRLVFLHPWVLGEEK